MWPPIRFNPPFVKSELELIDVDADELKTLFQKAAELAGELPDNMQAVGFNRALDLLMAAEGSEVGRGRKRRARGRIRKPAKKAAPKKNSEPSQASRRSTRTGARTALREIATGDFFKSPKTIVQVQKYLETKRALRFTQSALSPHLTYLVREGLLDREENEDKVYEYKLT